MQNVMVIIGSVREGRIGDKIGKYVSDILSKTPDVKVDLVDLKELKLPFYDEAFPPMMKESMNLKYKRAETEEWSARIKTSDKFVVVSPEYNHIIPSSLAAAFEWEYAGFVDKSVMSLTYSIGENAGRRAGVALDSVYSEFNMKKLAEVNIPNIKADNLSEVLEQNKSKLEDAIKDLLV